MNKIYLYPDPERFLDVVMMITNTGDGNKKHLQHTPSIINPLTPHPKPSALHPQPSTVDTGHSTINPQSFTLNPQPLPPPTPSSKSRQRSNKPHTEHPKQHSANTYTRVGVCYRLGGCSRSEVWGVMWQGPISGRRAAARWSSSTCLPSTGVPPPSPPTARYAYICINIYVYIHINIRICIYIHTYICVYICTHIHIYIYIQLYIFEKYGHIICLLVG